MRWPFRRTPSGRHALGAAVTAIPSAPVPPALAVSLPVPVQAAGAAPPPVVVAAVPPAAVVDVPQQAAPASLPVAPAPVAVPAPVRAAVPITPPASARAAEPDLAELPVILSAVPPASPPVVPLQPVEAPPAVLAPPPASALPPAARVVPTSAREASAALLEELMMLASVDAPQLDLAVPAPPAQAPSLPLLVEDHRDVVPQSPQGVATPAGPRVELGFADGSYRMLDPASPAAHALQDLVAELTGRERAAGSSDLA